MREDPSSVQYIEIPFREPYQLPLADRWPSTVLLVPIMREKPGVDLQHDLSTFDDYDWYSLTVYRIRYMTNERWQWRWDTDRAEALARAEGRLR